MKGAEGFEEAAVISKAAVCTGIQYAAPSGDLTAAVLHAEIVDVAMDALHGVFLERAGEVLTACKGILCKGGSGQVGIGIMLAYIFYSSGDQGAGGAGRLCVLLLHDLVNKKLKLDPFPYFL